MAEPQKLKKELHLDEAQQTDEVDRFAQTKAHGKEPLTSDCVGMRTMRMRENRTSRIKWGVT